MEKGIKSLGNNIYKVPSETVPNLSYVFDTFFGVCECNVGSAGAPCKHQFIFWSTEKVANPNFLPYFSEEDRQNLLALLLEKLFLLNYIKGCIISQTYLYTRMKYKLNIMLQLLITQI